jgi:hypothetical protein
LESVRRAPRLRNARTHALAVSLFGARQILVVDRNDAAIVGADNRGPLSQVAKGDDVRRLQSVGRSCVVITAIAAVTLVMVPPALAGAPPNLLDRNLGFVLSHPRIHNVFWDSDWNTHNPQFPTGTLNTFTSRLTTNGYLGPAAQYGVGTPRFAGSTLANFACLSNRAPNTVNEATIAAWLLCEVTNPFSGVPAPSPRLPVSNDLYIVYLPTNTRISGVVSFPAFSVLGHTFGPFTIGPPFCVQSPSGIVEGDHWILPTPPG